MRAPQPNNTTLFGVSPVRNRFGFAPIAWLRKQFTLAVQKGPVVGALIGGAINGLMPCSMTMAMAVKATTAPSVLEGGLLGGLHGAIDGAVDDVRPVPPRRWPEGALPVALVPVRVAGDERVAKWKVRTVALLTEAVGPAEGQKFAAIHPGPSFTNDLVEEFNDLIDGYRTPLAALIGALAVLALCAALELPHWQTGPPLQTGIENAVAQLVWSL